MLTILNATDNCNYGSFCFRFIRNLPLRNVNKYVYRRTGWNELLKKFDCGAGTDLFAVFYMVVTQILTLGLSRIRENRWHFGPFDIAVTSK